MDKLAIDKLIPSSTGKDMVYYENGDTKNIMKVVFKAYKKGCKQLAKIKPYIVGKNVLETCENIFNLVKQNISYKVDPIGEQFIKLPSRLWESKVGDCKSFSIFICACLDAVGIKGAMRFVSFNQDPTPTHVYVVVKTGSKEIIIDAVLNDFNYEKPYQKKYDYNMSKIVMMSGIGEATNENEIGALRLVKPLHEMTEHDLSLALLRQKLQLEKKHEAKSATDLHNYNNLIGAVEDEMLAGFYEYIGIGAAAKKTTPKRTIKTSTGKKIAVAIKKTSPLLHVAKGYKKVIKKAIPKVKALAQKAIFTKGLPTVGINFLYVFIPEKLAPKLPTIVANKRKKQLEVMQNIVDTIGIKKENVLKLFANGIKKETGKTPQIYLADQLKTISGIGFAPMAAAAAFKTGKAVAEKFFILLQNAFDKKFNVDIAEFAPAPEDWGMVNTGNTDRNMEANNNTINVARTLENEPVGKPILPSIVRDIEAGGTNTGNPDTGITVKKNEETAGEAGEETNTISPSNSNSASIVNEPNTTPTNEKSNGNSLLLISGLTVAGLLLLNNK